MIHREHIEQLSPHEAEAQEKTFLGFWIYLMTDLVMFAALFATFAVLRNNVHGGISMADIFDGPFVLTETMLLLTSSFTMGIGMLYAYKRNVNLTLTFLGITFLLGAGFLGMELTEFHHLFAEGNNPQRSAFLSSFFTLVGTHGLHITVGLLWISICMILVRTRGITNDTLSKLMRLSLFWHFLDIVWIFIFTIVYLMGAL